MGQENKKFFLIKPGQRIVRFPEEGFRDDSGKVVLTLEQRLQQLKHQGLQVVRRERAFVDHQGYIDPNVQGWLAIVVTKGH